MILLKCLQKCKIGNFPPFSLLHILVLPLLSKYGRKNRFLFFPIGQQAMDKTLGRLTRRFPDRYLSGLVCFMRIEFIHPRMSFKVD